MNHRSDSSLGPPLDPGFTEEQARRIWERAARLQASASDPGPSGGGDVASLRPTDEAGTRLDLATVRRAAAEAGIGSRWVDAALLDLDGPEQVAADRWAARYLGDESPTAMATRRLDGTPEEVYHSLQRVMPSNPYGFTLRRVIGGKPLAGGTMVFDIPLIGIGLDAVLMQGPVADLRHWAEYREIRLRIEPAEGEPGSTRVVISAPRVHARRTGFWVGQAFGAATGLVTGALVLVLVVLGAPAAGASGPLAGALAAGAAAATAGAGWWAGSRLWRHFYRYGQRRGESALEGILDAIDLDLETGGAFRRPVGDGSPPTSARMD